MKNYKIANSNKYVVNSTLENAQLHAIDITGTTDIVEITNLDVPLMFRGCVFDENSVNQFVTK